MKYTLQNAGRSFKQPPRRGRFTRWLTTALSAPSNLLPAAEKIGCLQIALRVHMQAREIFSLIETAKAHALNPRILKLHF